MNVDHVYTIEVRPIGSDWVHHSWPQSALEAERVVEELRPQVEVRLTIEWSPDRRRMELSDHEWTEQEWDKLPPAPDGEMHE